MSDLELGIGDGINVSRYYNEQPFAGLPPWVNMLLRSTSAGGIIRPMDTHFQFIWNEEVRGNFVWPADKRYIEGTHLVPTDVPPVVRRGLTINSLLGTGNPTMDVLRSFVPDGVTFVRVTGACTIQEGD